MTLAKLSIVPEKASGVPPLEVMFNPSEMRLTKNVNWEDVQPVEKLTRRFHFKGTSPWTLAIDLFFDTYATPVSQSGLGAVLAAIPSFGLVEPSAPEPTSVLDVMAPLLDLAVPVSERQPVSELHRPPSCELQWGKFLFRGVLQQANPTLTLFASNGTPVRATVACTFQGDIGPETRGEFHSPDVVKRHTVRPGDTLMALASLYYNDRAQWRRIADANRIENPRELDPGSILTIPRIAQAGLLR